MFKHLWVERNYVIWSNQTLILINNQPIMTSTLAAGIVPAAFDGEAGEA